LFSAVCGLRCVVQGTVSEEESDVWEDCGESLKSLALPLIVLPVSADIPPGESPYGGSFSNLGTK
jgi:hypothetical protein